MMVIRPIVMQDLDQLLKLANTAKTGLTTLPKNLEKLKEKIEASLLGFSKSAHEPGNDAYLFVLEDTNTQTIVGTSGMVSQVGTTEPFYSYKVSTQVHTSSELDMYKKLDILHLCNDYTEASEIGTLFLAPDYRKGGNGRLLSRCRFLFMANFPQRFSSLVIAEMRGLQNTDGRSSFWQSLGKIFFDMNFAQADALSGIGMKQFITDLIPRYPIYVQLLPEAAQKAVGAVHENTIPALKMLEKEGFRYKNYVDIFDAGPTIEANTSEIFTVRTSVEAPIQKLVDSIESETFLISNTQLDFRAGMGTLSENEDRTINLTKEVAQALNVQVGDSVRYVLFRSPKS